MFNPQQTGQQSGQQTQITGHSIQQALSGVVFPASRQSLIDAAYINSGVDQQVIDMLKSLPDREYLDQLDVQQTCFNQSQQSMTQPTVNQPNP